MGTVQLSPPAAPFSRIKNPGESITIKTAGKVLVIPTGNSSYLPSFNEYVLNSNRLTIAESPFGGLKGAGSPDYAVGTLFTPTDGVYLTDKDGNNSTKTLTAGKLKEVSSLTVDASAKTITEEFIIKNDSVSNAPVYTDSLNSVTGWTIGEGTGNPGLSVSGGIKCTALCSAGGRVYISKSITIPVETKFWVYTITCNKNATLITSLASGNNVSWTGRNFPLAANVPTTFVLPIYAPTGTIGSLPFTRFGTLVYGGTIACNFGVAGLAAGESVEFTISSFSIDVGKTATLELDVPDNLAASSLTLQCWTGAAYETCRVCRLDSTFSDVSTTPANVKFLDGTKTDDVYGAGLGRAVFPKGVSGATVNGSTGTMTFSGNKGTSRRIGIKIDLPPSDSGRTNFNKIRLKTILTYASSGATSYDFEDSTNASYGLQNITKKITTDGSVIPDFSGSGNTGEIFGGATKQQTNYKFDGSSGYILTPVIDDMDSYSFSCELVIDSFSDNANIITTFYDNGALDRAGFCLGADSNGIFLNHAQTNGTMKSIVIPATTGTRYLISGGYDAGQNIIWLTINGNRSEETVAGKKTVSNVVNLGKYPGASIRYFNGKIYSLSLQIGSNTLEYRPSEDRLGESIYVPWIALYDPAKSLIDFYLFTHRPKALTRKKNDSGEIYELTLYPGNGSIFYGRITNANLTTDSDSNLIPDCLESSIEGSVTKFLSSYGMVI